MVTGTTIFAGALLMLIVLLTFGDQHGIRSVQGRQGLQDADEPQLNGSYFRITVVEERGFLDFDVRETTDVNGSISRNLTFSGYCIDLLNAIARPDRANFTFELIPPSGTGSLCEPMLNQSEDELMASTFDPVYYTQYNCGQSEVTDVPSTNYTTDMYLLHVLHHSRRNGKTVAAIQHGICPAPFRTETSCLEPLLESGTCNTWYSYSRRGNKGRPACRGGAANVEFVRIALHIEMVEVLGTG